MNMYYPDMTTHGFKPSIVNNLIEIREKREKIIHSDSEPKIFVPFHNEMITIKLLVLDLGIIAMVTRI